MRDKKVFNLVMLAILITVVIVLQMISALIVRITFVSITLALIPIVVGGILLGVKQGLILGFTFGVVVTINCITGFDAGGAILFNVNPFLTVLTCLFKGTMAGLVPAVIFYFLKNKSFIVAIIIATIIAPIMNTGLFLIAMPVFFYDTLVIWANGQDIAYYMFFGLVGTNFLIEFILNIVLSPVVVRLIKIPNETE